MMAETYLSEKVVVIFANLVQLPYTVSCSRLPVVITVEGSKTNSIIILYPSVFG